MDAAPCSTSRKHMAETTPAMIIEEIVDDHEWLRVADPNWADPLDSTFAASRGGRWNPPNSYRVLYLNEDVVTARLNLRAFVAPWPYEPEDLRPDTAPVLVGARLPSSLRAVDIHSPTGVTAVGLPGTYPVDDNGQTVSHAVCQPIGVQAKEAQTDGIRCRCAQSPSGEGRELAWFPTENATPEKSSTTPYAKWYWG